jgi:hypothetical protein
MTNRISIPKLSFVCFVVKKTKQSQIPILVFLGSWILVFLAFCTNEPNLKTNIFTITSYRKTAYDNQPSTQDPKKRTQNKPI